MNHYHRPCFIVRFFQMFNWDVVFNWACWLAVVVCLAYIGIFIISPFKVRFVWQ